MFYDGNYFLHVSNYYNYDHSKRKRISLSGLHEFVKRKVAEFEQTETQLCRIVDAHYFRGRLTASEASQRGDTLYWDRVFDDVLMSEGITTHYLPLRSSTSGSRIEKGIDVWLAMEAYELAVHKKYDVFVMLAGDGDYVPLVRKLNTLGCRVMVLSWDFEYTAENGRRMVTRTSQDLLAEASYPMAMHEEIDARLKKDDLLIHNIFVATESRRSRYQLDEFDLVSSDADYDPDTAKHSMVMSIKSGYGFIKYPPNNLFFHYSSLVNADFSEIHEGDEVEFYIGRNDDGQPIAINVLPTFAIGRTEKPSEALKREQERLMAMSLANLEATAGSDTSSAETAGAPVAEVAETASVEPTEMSFELDDEDAL
jgi:uncharacterized LabA/DUF88 family protein/cold shock CspA family protein